MKKISVYLLILSSIILGLQLTDCTRLQDLENILGNPYQTNVVVISNTSAVRTNLIYITNIIKISDTYYQTNIVIATNITWLSTNFIQKEMVYQPIPSWLWVYVDSGPYSWWTLPTVHWWDQDGNTGEASKLSNVSDGYVTWWVFQITGIDLQKRIGVKVHNNNWESVEPIKTENGNKYDRIIKMPILTKADDSMYSTTTTNGSNVCTTNYVTTLISTYDKVFVYPPDQWYKSFPYLLETETNLFRDPPGQNSGWLWNQYLGANYWGGGVTCFMFYAPNVRKVMVEGTFSSWKPLPMYLSTDKTFWWAILSNTQPGDAYKFGVEKYANEWGGPYTDWITDPAAKKNKHTGPYNESYIVDHAAFQWEDGSWSKPGFEYYTIYQMHMRTFYTNGEGSYWGWGTFYTATNKLNYISDMGFTAVEPLPIFEFAGDQSWGYNYVLFYSPETSYCASESSPDAFKVFVNECHKRGLAVVADLVFNHMGASDDVLGFIDPAVDWNSPNTYFYMYKTDWGPRFNYANPVIAKFLTDSAVYLMQYYHIDGFRFDATYYIHWNDSGNDGGTFLYNMTRDIKTRAAGMPCGANVILMAENLPNDPWITGDGGFNFQWNADMAHELKKLFTSGPSAISIAGIAGNLNAASMLQYACSHDEAANGKERMAADLHYVRGWENNEYNAQCQMVTALATVLMGKGVPMILMGDETLEGFYDDPNWGPPYNSRYFTDSKALSWNNDYYNRTDGYPVRVEAAWTAAAIKDLAWVRKNNDAIKYYDINVFHQNESGKVIAFTRGGNILVVINYNKLSYGGYSLWFPAGQWDLIFAHPSGTYGNPWADSYFSGYISSGGENHSIGLPEYGVLVYKKR
jgi:1,4-alpha-glucan branching enzyme